MREVVFDTETTGLSPRDGDRVIEIGAVELVNHFPTGKSFHVYINPGERKVDPGAFDVHGLSNERLASEPPFDAIVDDFMAFFAEGTLIAHNASFDIGFLNAELARFDKPPIRQDRVIDTLQIARRRHPAGPNSLDALCGRYGIDNAHRTLHGALLDSQLLAEVYLELIGGRQAALGLGTAEDEANNVETIEQSGFRRQNPRPQPLAARLTDAERAAHQQFVKTLGEEAVWLRYKTP
jgi:DNA polymerase-3 subunit epsilon